MKPKCQVQPDIIDDLKFELKINNVSKKEEKTHKI